MLQVFYYEYQWLKQGKIYAISAILTPCNAAFYKMLNYTYHFDFGSLSNVCYLFRNILLAFYHLYAGHIKVFVF